MATVLKPRKSLPTVKIPQGKTDRNWGFALTVIALYGTSAAVAIRLLWILLHHTPK